MGARSKDKIKEMIVKDIVDVYNRFTEVKQTIDDNLKDTMDYLRLLLAQIPESASGPLIARTPKVLRKRGVKPIETIPENEVIDVTSISDSTAANATVDCTDMEVEAAEGTISGRRKREASRKAANSIKIQQSLTLSTKLRRPSSSDDNDTAKNKIRDSRSKRKKSTKSSSDEESAEGPRKISKVDTTITVENALEKAVNSNSHDEPSTKDITLKQESIEDDKAFERHSMTRRSSNRKRTFSQIQDFNGRKCVIADDTVIAPTTNDVEEPSMYEDALGKPMPIMNSTMNFNSTYNIQKMINATVVLEPLSAIKLNETVTINKKSDNDIGKNNVNNTVQPKFEFKSPRLSKLSSPSSKALQDRIEQIKQVIANKEFDELITDDESSPELKKPRSNIGKQQRVTRSMVSSEDEILSTPAKPTLKEVTAGSTFLDVKNTYKSNALFSPYAKKSVKKRVEAFEQVGISSPKPAIDIDAPTRVTRTKTRAKAAAQAEMEEKAKAAEIAEKTVAHKLARKSLAKAKKISLAKEAKNADEFKENKIQMKQQILLEKINQKQQKATPLSKTKLQLPTSISRIPQTPVNNQSNATHTKALSATRANIITTMDSFIQPPKSVNKCNSVDKAEERRKRLNDDDARKKREETLRLQTEEKRRKRQEKELKNKLAREAKEKLEMEKRQKAEKEREEKARLAQQMMEKQREEIEKKRMAQLQRAQEKEEKRKQEEQLRLQRLYEQEEAERILAEQRRREQEAEKRKEAEARAQQQTAAEAMKVKNQMLGAKYGNKYHGPTNYILDSEPDENESDDESQPKHTIPYWAHPQVRRDQLAMQRFIPEKAVYKFFGSRKCTPDLSELFQGIDKSRLKRTSSAIWRTPPRFSMIDPDSF